MASEYLVIDGGKRLEGSVEVSGAKNSALKQIAASLILANGKTILHKVPKLADIDYMLEIIRLLGGSVDIFDEGIGLQTLVIDCSDLSSDFIPYSLAGKLRASFVCFGALLARFKNSKVAFPGGCQIGSRKVDLHLKGLKALGAEIREEQGYIQAKAKKLLGTKIYLDLPSNGATENIMIAATLAEGETIIENAARDPEIIDLANFLNKMGCDIRGAGSSNIHIYGKAVEELHSVEHTTIPDRIEAATYLAAGIITKGKVTVENVLEEDLQSLLSKIEDLGAQVIVHGTGEMLDGQELVNITVDAKNKKLKGTDITTVWFPGFSTDIQPIFTSILTLCEGTSMVTENIYDSRFSHCEDLNRMGADIDISGKTAVIRGVKQLSGANLEGKDLRATAALVVAALAAKGKSEVSGLTHLDRGYEHLEDKFRDLGADIRRVRSLDETISAQSTNEKSSLSAQ